MLEMRPDCEKCGTDLPAEVPGAFICSFECTFCAECAEALDDAFEDAIHAQCLAHHRLKFRKQRVRPVGPVLHLSAVPFVLQQPGAVQLLEFRSDMPRRGPKLVGKLPQIGLTVGVQKKTHQYLDAHFGGDQAVEHG